MFKEIVEHRFQVANLLIDWNNARITFPQLLVFESNGCLVT